jgi:hypothetical protein
MRALRVGGFDAPYDRKFNGTLNTTERNARFTMYPSTWISHPLILLHPQARRCGFAGYSNAKFWVVLYRPVLELVFLKGEVLVEDRNIEGAVDKQRDMIR